MTVIGHQRSLCYIHRSSTALACHQHNLPPTSVAGIHEDYIIWPLNWRRDNQYQRFPMNLPI